MFRIAKSSAYWWPVKLKVVPEDAPGTTEEQSFEAQFRRFDTEGRLALTAEIREQQLLDPAIVQRVVTSLRKVLDEQGAEVAYSQAVLDRILKEPGVASAIVEAFFESWGAAAEKN